MFRLPLATLSLAVLGGAVAQSAAQDKPPSPVKLTASTFLVTQVQQDGKTIEKLIDAPSANPGNLLQMTQRLENVTGTQAKPFALKGVALTQTINASTVYQSDKCSVDGVTALFSLDGKTFAAAPLKKTVTVKENGVDVTREVEVQPNEYTALRWQLPDLKPGDVIECSLRVAVK